ncbi:hypothetical protein [Roseibaca calidilacus]|uniref:hypothetical protein n=1 Tax=Roseibaca calidilacus TaxID=1666912 RepID=UPI00159ECC1E|nr:hypothetical protein [Roseibaca calidilacus]
MRCDLGCLYSSLNAVASKAVSHRDTLFNLAAWHGTGHMLRNANSTDEASDDHL